jgi:hypothetical protein
MPEGVMADKARRVEYYYIQVPDQPGQGFEALAKLKEAGVNLIAFLAFPVAGGKTQMDFVPEASEKFLAVAKGAGWKLSAKKEAFYVQGSDRPGVAAAVLEKLSSAKINAVATSGIGGEGGGYGLMVWVKPNDVSAAAKALGA